MRSVCAARVQMEKATSGPYRGFLTWKQNCFAPLTVIALSGRVALWVLNDCTVGWLHDRWMWEWKEAPSLWTSRMNIATAFNISPFDVMCLPGMHSKIWTTKEAIIKRPDLEMCVQSRRKPKKEVLTLKHSHSENVHVLMLTYVIYPHRVPVAGWWCMRAGSSWRTLGRCTTTPWLEVDWDCLSSLRNTFYSRTSDMSAEVRYPVKICSVNTLPVVENVLKANA